LRIYNLQLGTVYYYRVKSITSCGTSVASNIVSFSKPCDGISGGDVTPALKLVCPNTTTELYVSGSTGGTLQWQQSSNNEDWTDIDGATEDNVSFMFTGDYNYFRCVTRSASCYDVSSTTAQVLEKRNPKVTVTQVTSNSVTISWEPFIAG